MASGNPQNTSPKPSGKKAKPLSQKEQSERFIKTALELGTDETGAAFDHGFDAVVKPNQGIATRHRKD